MKTIARILIFPGVAAALAIPARAIEAPEDDAPPPAAANAEAAAEAAAPEAKPADKPQTAYLGVVTSDVPEMLAEHLGMKPGQGIIVRSVMPEGPAANAGVAVNDVITHVDGKAVASATDLTKQIGTHKPGDTVKLDVIQKGKAGNLDVTLGKRPEQIAEFGDRPLDGLPLEGVPNDLADRVRRMIEGNLGGMELQLDGGAQLDPPPQIEDAMRQMKERMEKAMGGFNLEAPGIAGRVEVQKGATFRIMDDQGSVEMIHDGSKEVTVRDKDNQITWNGPWDTDQDKAAAPDEVRHRVERLNIDTRFKGQGIQLRMGPAIIPELEENPE